MEADPTEEPSTIAFCIEELSVGGAEHMVVVLANEFVKRGWRVHVVCLTAAGELVTRLAAGVQLHVLHKKRGIDLFLPWRLSQCIRAIRPDVINSHLWVANTWTRVSLLGNSIPIVVTEHSRDIWKPMHYRWIDKCLSLRSCRLVAVSADTADFYRNAIAVGDDLVTIVHNGVDTRRYSQGDGRNIRACWLGKSGNGDNCSILIGTVGRLVPAKNHVRLLDAIAILTRDNALENFDIYLKIVGEGPERGRIQHHIEQLDLSDRVSLTGARHDIPDVLAALDIFVLSSDREGHPLTAMEAQAAGTPVVLTDAGGSGETIARKCDGGASAGGFLVEKDPAAIAAALKTLILDQRLRLSCAEFAREFALSHFDMQQMIDHYEHLFAAAVAAR